MFEVEGRHSTMDSVLALHPAGQGLNTGVQEILSEKKIVDVAKINRRHCCLEKRTAEA